MRANINFDVDVHRVEDIMTALVLQESNSLHHITSMLTQLTEETLYPELVRAIDGLKSTVHQLEQYRDMIVSFEQARFQTMIPQPAPEAHSSPLGQSAQQVLAGNLKTLRETVDNMKNFDSFIEKINEPVGDEDDVTPKEG